MRPLMVNLNPPILGFRLVASGIAIYARRRRRRTLRRCCDNAAYFLGDIDIVNDNVEITRLRLCLRHATAGEPERIVAP